MGNLTQNPAFVAYCLCAAVLTLNLLGLWGYSGAVRTKTKTTPNPEDSTTVAKGAEVMAETPPEVARVLRAHANATANNIPFLVLGFLYVLLGASPMMAWILFGAFTVARIGHTFAYLGEKQPWRTILFSIGGVLSLVVWVEVVRRAIPLL